MSETAESGRERQNDIKHMATAVRTKHTLGHPYYFVTHDNNWKCDRIMGMRSKIKQQQKVH